MSYNKKANEVRTKLLLKTQSEIYKFTESKTLINTISPKNLYNLYSNIEIKENTYEYSIVERIENQRKFYDDSQISKIEMYTPYMEVFKKINKMLISEKKNQTFYNLLNSNKNINEYKNSTPNLSLISFYKTPKENILNNILKEDKTNTSIKFLRQKAQNLINIINRKKIRFKTHSNSFYQNPNYKTQNNLKLEKKKKKSGNLKLNKNIYNKEFKVIEDNIMNCSPVIYISRGLEKKKSSSGNYYKNSSFRSSLNLSNKKDSISQISQVSFSNRNNRILIKSNDDNPSK